MLKLIKDDNWLKPYASAIEGRYQYFVQKKNELTNNGKQSLSDFATGHLYFGLHKTDRAWIFREWAPNATAIYLTGTFNNWKKLENFALKKLQNGVWEIVLPINKIKHLDLFKLIVCWEGGQAERIPAWATRVVQDPVTMIFSAQVWAPENPYIFKKKKFTPQTDPLFIYECHIGMASNQEKVGTYEEFRRDVLPRIKEDGYNTIQIMAIQEHPYYGSFGYHVSSFFAASSRFGTPDELKHLVDDAHAMGIAVIMDIVHSHAVKNENEGLGRFDGSYDQYFLTGDRRLHPAWDSLCFNYKKNEVLHFLLSNCKFWLEEYNFDGFRFDGVTSMLYYSHGLGETFTSYDDYFNGNQDGDAICYLTLANQLIQEVKPKAITVAEEVSGMPGLASTIKNGGYGFKYRMAMNIPDYWIKIIKEKKDEEWNVTDIYWQLTNRRADEKTISYAESHDQALVGDKTIIFRLIDADMYWHMSKFGEPSLKVDRGIALHKMIRLITASTINGGYLNFMGNEFGHPEWIDFPREGNNWSYKYAKRQWQLADDPNLRYVELGDFDKAMLHLLKFEKHVTKEPIVKLWDNQNDQVLVYKRGELIFVFNFNPTTSFSDYGFLAPEGAYQTVLNTDSPNFGGNGLIDENTIHFTQNDDLYKKDQKGWLKIYIPARCAMVLKKNE